MSTLFLDKFNNTFKELLNDIKQSYNNNFNEFVDDEIIESYLGKDNTKLINDYYKNVKEVGNELSNKDEFIFSENIELIKGINFFKIWNSELSDETKESIWKYLHTMYLYSDNYNRNTNLSEVMSLYKKASETDHLDVDNETKVLFGILDNLCGSQVVINESDKSDPYENKDNKTNNDTSSKPSGGSGFNTDEFMNNPMFGGSIGKLATEIAGEIDTSSFETEDPNQMITNLLSGNMSKDSPVLKLVHQISDSIQSKLTSGDINEMDLFKEAQNVMSSMGSTTNSSSEFLNKMSKDISNISLNNNENDDDNDINDVIKKNMSNILESSTNSVSKESKRVKILKEKARSHKILLEKKKRLAKREKLI